MALQATASSASLVEHRRRHSPATLLRRLRHVYWQEVTPTRQSLLISWMSFGLTWGTVRFITHGIRGGWLPIHNVSEGGRHIHHYNFGIALLGLVGLVAVRGTEGMRRHPLVAIAYGVGGALIADEFAMLLDLQDVYWAKDGRKSVDVAVGILSLAGAYFAAAPFWHGVAREVARTRPTA